MDVLILHGALGSAHQFSALSHTIPGSTILEFVGHGASANVGEQWTIDTFVEQLEQYLQQRASPVAVFGYSMGGYVALSLAKRRPELFTRILTLGTKFAWDPTTVSIELSRLDANVIQQKVPAFADDLAARHGEEHWRTVLQKTAHLMAELGVNPRLSPTSVEQITVPVRLCLGDRDEMVTIEETIAIYRGLRRSIAGSDQQLAVLPGVRHPIERVPVATLKAHINDWLLQSIA